MTLYIAFLVFTVGIYLVNWLLIVRAHALPKDKEPEELRNEPLVAILVPAYNEEVGIVDSIWSLLKQDYSNFEVVVVDDGSTDGTYEVLYQTFGDHPKVHIFSRANCGKADTLNFAARMASFMEPELFMCIDADTILPRHALRTMVANLGDHDAVAAMVGIHNGLEIQDGQPVKPTLPNKLVTKIQWLEYAKSYTIFRCSMRDKNAITVISGAVGLITRDMFVTCGGYKTWHLGEDMELTLNIHANGGSIKFLQETLAWTEAPETVKDLGKQRVRWYRGAVQALWAHRGLLFRRGNKTLNWFLLPYVWLSDIIGVWVEALSWVYLLYLLSIGSGVALWYFLFIVGFYINTLMVLSYVRRRFDVAYKSIWKAAALGMIEGLGYHFLFLFWSLKAQTRQIFGVKNKWNKLARIGAQTTK